MNKESKFVGRIFSIPVTKLAPPYLIEILPSQASGHLEKGSISGAQF